MSKIMAVMVGAGGMAAAYFLMMDPVKREQMINKAEHYYHDISKKM